MKCSVAGCGLSLSKNRPNLSFHRLPRNESRKKIWLQMIGVKNLRPGTKHINICSLHFEDSAFNRTLNVLRLKDDAVPTLFKKTIQPSSNLDRLEPSPLVGSCHKQPSCTNDSHIIQDTQNLEKTIQPPSNLNRSESWPSVVGSHQQPSCSNDSHILQDTQNPEKASGLDELKKLQEKVLKQKKKIKALNEKVRRQKRKLENFTNIIIELKEKHFLKSHKSKNLTI